MTIASKTSRSFNTVLCAPPQNPPVACHTIRWSGFRIVPDGGRDGAPVTDGGTGDGRHGSNSRRQIGFHPPEWPESASRCRCFLGGLQQSIRTRIFQSLIYLVYLFNLFSTFSTDYFFAFVNVDRHRCQMSVSKSVTSFVKIRKFWVTRVAQFDSKLFKISQTHSLSYPLGLSFNFVNLSYCK